MAAASPVDVDALRETQNRADQLLSELAAARAKSDAKLDAANRQIAALEKRLGTTARRLAQVETVARQALEAAAKVDAAAKTSSATPPEAASTASMQDKLRRLSAQEARTQPRAASETIVLPAAPANASLQPDPTP